MCWFKPVSDTGTKPIKAVFVVVVGFGFGFGVWGGGMLRYIYVDLNSMNKIYAAVTCFNVHASVCSSNYIIFFVLLSHLFIIRLFCRVGL